MRFPKLCIVALFAVTVLAAQTGTLTNADVVKMVKSGMADTAIVAAIAGSDSQFDLSSTGLQGLSQAGVSSKVIRAMLAAKAKKDAAAAPVQDTSATASSGAAASSDDSQNSAAQAAGSQGMSSQGMPPGMPAGMSSEQMAQMMASMPPAVRERMQASMAKRNANRAAMAANSIAPHAGLPVPLDSVLYTSFARLQSQGRYRAVMTLQTNDPRMQQGMAQAKIQPAVLTVQGDTRQYVMHYAMPAMDAPGVIDDWEIRAVVQNGRAASLMTSPAVPRILKFNAEKAAHDLAMLDAMAANAVAHAAAEGPLGAIGAGMTAVGVAMAHAESAKALKMGKEMFSWKCRAAPQGDAPGGKSATQLTDIHPIEEQNVDGRPAAAYEFYAYTNEKTQGKVQLLVAKDTGLPLRLEMGDPNTTGGVQMVYSQLDSPVDIEIPACMSGAK